MKKSIFIFPLLTLSVLSISQLKGQGLKEAHAEELETYINVSDLFLDFNEDKGSIADKNATFWGEGYSFNALDNFYRGESKEGWTGSLTTKTWKQTTPFIYFQWGGAKDYNAEGVEGEVYLNIHYGTEGNMHVSKVMNNTFAENPMLLRYFEVPSDIYSSFNGNPFDMYIELIDGKTGDYGFHNFGYLHVNQNEEQVREAMYYYLNHVDITDTRDWKKNNNKAIYGHYFANGDLRRVFLKTADNIDEDFEDNAKFTNNWYLDLNYDNYLDTARHVDNVIGTDIVRGGSNMPFNKTGEGYFKGWYEHSLDAGYIDSDKPIYRFVSRPFVLSNTGLVSIKMAGRSASLHVIDTETQKDLAWVDLRTFKGGTDEDQNIQALTGFNTVTMVRHLINLEEFKGKTIQLALADVFDNNWAASYFDELVTNYSEYPAFDFDVVEQENETATSYKIYRDQYISSTHIDNDSNGVKYTATKEEVTRVDETPSYEAYKFLNDYFDNYRNLENGFDVSKLSEESKKGLLAKYNELSDDAKKIVIKSTDFAYEELGEEWYKSSPNKNGTVGDTLSAINDEFRDYVVSFSSNGGSGIMDDVEIRGAYTLPTCTFTAPEGKEFDSWMVGETKYAPGEEINVTKDIEIKATWKDIPTPEPVKYVVSFDSNTGSGTMENVEVLENTEYELPTCTFTAPEGKEFNSWLVNEVEYQPGEEITVNENTTVVATWKDIPTPDPVKYVVSFDANSGSGNMKSVEVLENTNYELPTCDFVAPEGKEFDSWMVNGNKYQPGDEIVVNENTTVTATWKDIPTPEPVKYVVSFNSNSGTGTMESVEVLENTEYELPTCTFTAPEGKEFDSWTVNGEKHQPGEKVTITENTVVTATWKDVTPVTPQRSGGCGGNIAMTSVLLSTLSLLGFSLIFMRKVSKKEK